MAQNGGTPKIHPAKRPLDSCDSFKPRRKNVHAITQENFVPRDSPKFTSQDSRQPVIVAPPISQMTAPPMSQTTQDNNKENLLASLDQLLEKIQPQVADKQLQSVFAELSGTLGNSDGVNDPTGRQLQMISDRENKLRAKLDQLQATYEKNVQDYADSLLPKEQHNEDLLTQLQQTQQENQERANKYLDKYNRISSLRMMEERSNVFVSFENGKYTVSVKIKDQAEFKFRFWEIGNQ